MPPVMAMRDLRVLSSPPQVVHFIPMQATPRPATVTIMLTIMRARVAWRAPSVRDRIRLIHQLQQLLVCLGTVSKCTGCGLWQRQRGYTGVRQKFKKNHQEFVVIMFFFLLLLKASGNASCLEVKKAVLTTTVHVEQSGFCFLCGCVCVTASPCNNAPQKLALTGSLHTKGYCGGGGSGGQMQVHTSQKQV